MKQNLLTMSAESLLNVLFDQISLDELNPRRDNERAPCAFDISFSCYSEEGISAALTGLCLQSEQYVQCGFHKTVRLPYSEYDLGGKGMGTRHIA